MSKGFWAVIAIIVVIFGGILFLKGGNKTNAPGNPNQVTNHVKGEGQKGVTLVEYGDYQCPVCGAYFAVVEQVYAKYAQDLKFQFSNLPLTQIHQNAFAGARAAEAAGLQNKYWEMHDLLYQNQTAWSQASNPQPYFERYAQQIGLKVSQFKTDFASAQVNNFINADLKAFDKTGNKLATPTFFLNGEKIEPTLSYTADNKSVDVAASVQTFSKAIDEAIAKKASQPIPATQQPTQ